jgi:hypothetical protein
MLILNADEIHKALPMKDAIEAMKQPMPHCQMEKRKCLYAAACQSRLMMV